MEYTLRWRDDPENEGSWSDPEDLLITTAGRVSVGDLEAMHEAAWADPHFRSGLKTLIDHRATNYGDLSPAQAQDRAHWVVAHQPDLSGSRTAVVVSRPVDYGVWRIFNAYIVDHIDFEMEIFRTPEEARAWLAEPSS